MTEGNPTPPPKTSEQSGRRSSWGRVVCGRFGASLIDFPRNSVLSSQPPSQQLLTSLPVCIAVMEGTPTDSQEEAEWERLLHEISYGQEGKREDLGEQGKDKELSRAELAEIDRFLSRLREAGLDAPYSPYAQEGLLLMRNALGRLSRLLRQEEETN